MTTTVDDFLASTPEQVDELLVNGRYAIWPPGSEKRVLHTRVTNFARELEDTFSLTQWKLRTAITGTAQRSDLQAAIIAALGTDEERKELNEVAEKAMEFAKANERRDLGSALHKLCERVDNGEKLDLPDVMRADVDAYRTAMVRHGLEIVAVEEVCVIPSLTLAGRFDRVVRDRAGRLYIFDIKTGADLSYSWGSIAIQLALYADAETIYDPATKAHAPMHEVDRSVGIVAHLPAGSGTCSLYLVDLDTGRRGIEVVTTLKDYRKQAKSIAMNVTDLPLMVIESTSTEIEATEVLIDTPASPELRAYVVARVRNVVQHGHAEQLARRWPVGVPTLKQKDDHLTVELDEILAVVIDIERQHELPFVDVTDPRATAPISPYRKDNT